MVPRVGLEAMVVNAALPGRARRQVVHNVELWRTRDTEAWAVENKCVKQVEHTRHVSSDGTRGKLVVAKGALLLSDL